MALDINTARSLLDAPKDAFQLALALQVLASKPSHLSVADHIRSLRSHAKPTVARTDFYFDTANYWRKRAEAQEALVETLRSKVLELEIRPRDTAAAAKPTAPSKSKPRPSRAKPKEKPADTTDTGVFAIPRDPTTTPVLLQNILILLERATEPEVIAHAVRQSCNEIVSLVEKAAASTARSPALTAAHLCAVAESVFTMSLKGAYKLPSQRRNEVGAVVVHALLEVLRCVHVNTCAILALGTLSAAPDIRIELTKLVTGVLEALYARDPTERDVLDGFVYGLFGLLRAALVEGTMEVEESGWYYGLVLEVAWRLVNKEGLWVKSAKKELLEELRELGGWRKSVDDAVRTLAGRLETSPFACLVTGIVGMEIFNHAREI
ncbi:hypothetical protein EDC01DRAFT_724870 [Geopyxis carbonaria]|nr:hypothetical protein EDC01DRAFT_724870 [Geopyxis carbonaria]